MGPQDIIEGTGAGVISEDLRAAAISCLSIDRTLCTDLAKLYTWEASIRQFRDCNEEAIRRHALELAAETEEAQRKRRSITRWPAVFRPMMRQGGRLKARGEKLVEQGRELGSRINRRIRGDGQADRCPPSLAKLRS
jgi:hypothetical protein